MIDQLNELWNTGRLLAIHPVSSSEENDKSILAWLEPIELEYREQLPFKPPAFAPEYAVWAAKQFYRASQLIVHRELGESFIQTGLETQPSLEESATPPSQLADVEYSVDLHFRFLPDLYRIAITMSQTDPLLSQLKAWRDRWPLSGARFASTFLDPTLNERLEPILQDRCLRILYIERRLSDPNISQPEIAHWNQVFEQHEWKSIAKQ